MFRESRCLRPQELPQFGARGSPRASISNRPKCCCVPFFQVRLRWAVRLGHVSAELSLRVSDRRRKTQRSGQNRSESLCAGLRAPCRAFWAWFGSALGPNPVRNRRFPAGSVKVFRALVAQPRCFDVAVTWSCPCDRSVATSEPEGDWSPALPPRLPRSEIMSTPMQSSGFEVLWRG